MANTTEFSNFLNLASVIEDHASENLVAEGVWVNLISRVALPVGTQTKELKKKGSLSRQILGENLPYVWGAGSEYLEGKTTLNLIKSVVMSRFTLEADLFSLSDPASVLGEEQGKAIGVGIDMDIAALVSGFSSSITSAATGATQLDLQACALAIMLATNNHANKTNLTAVLSPKTAFEMGVKSVLTPGNNSLATVYGSDNTSFRNVAENFGGAKPGNGFMANVGGIDVYTTNLVDDNGTNFRNLVFDRNRALVGMWQDRAITDSDKDIGYFRSIIATAHFSDFAIHWDEGGCQLLSPIV